jgi:hypothetical protein
LSILVWHKVRQLASHMRRSCVRYVHLYFDFMSSNRRLQPQMCPTMSTRRSSRSTIVAVELAIRLKWTSHPVCCFLV